MRPAHRLISPITVALTYKSCHTQCHVLRFPAGTLRAAAGVCLPAPSHPRNLAAVRGHTCAKPGNPPGGERRRTDSGAPEKRRRLNGAPSSAAIASGCVGHLIRRRAKRRKQETIGANETLRKRRTRKTEFKRN